jgi:type I restriction enzyme S subunit
MIENWSIIRLGDIAQKITKGGTPTTYGFSFQKTGINFLKVENIQNGVINLTSITDFISEKAHQFQLKSQLESGDLLFSIAGTIGVTTVIESKHLPANTNQALAIIKGTSGVLHSKFLLWQLEHFVQKIKSKARGGAMNNVSLEDLKNLTVYVPPLAIQHRIVNKIEELFSELDKGIESLKTAQQQLKVYRQAVLKYAFEGKFTNPDVKDGELPEGWENTSLSRVSILIGDGLHGTPEYDQNGEYYFINGNNLQNGKIEYKSSTKRVDESQFILYKKPLTKNTVFVSINGTIGNVAFYNDEPIILGKSACFINLKDGVDKYFIRYILMSHNFINYANKNATGSTIKNVGLKTIRDFQFSMPNKFDLQNQIVQEIESRLSVCDKIEESIEQGLQQAEALRQSILKKAFEGKLVPQDPNDEPASVLLKRIKAEREKAQPVKKIKTKKVKA